MNATKKTLSEQLERLSNHLSKFVVPLFEEGRDGRLSLHGSGFFIHAQGKHFLVSAAHVLETLITNPPKPLFYYVEPGFKRNLAGRMLLNPWQGDRNKDPIDVGVLRLSGEALPPYPNLNKFAIDVESVRPVHLPRTGKTYMVVGFPGTKTRLREGELVSKVYSYRNVSIEDKDYPNHDLHAEAHLAMPLDLKICSDFSGKQLDFPKPQGMSGSPIWAIYPDDVDEEGIESYFPLVAVATKYRKNTRLLIGTDVEIVRAMINELLSSDP